MILGVRKRPFGQNRSSIGGARPHEPLQQRDGPEVRDPRGVSTERLDGPRLHQERHGSAAPSGEGVGQTEVCRGQRVEGCYAATIWMAVLLEGRNGGGDAPPSQEQAAKTVGGEGHAVWVIDFPRDLIRPLRCIVTTVEFTTLGKRFCELTQVLDGEIG